MVIISASCLQASMFPESRSQPSASGQNEEPPPPYESVVMSEAVRLQFACNVRSCMQSASSHACMPAGCVKHGTKCCQGKLSRPASLPPFRQYRFGILISVQLCTILIQGDPEFRNWRDRTEIRWCSSKRVCYSKCIRRRRSRLRDQRK